MTDEQTDTTARKETQSGLISLVQCHNKSQITAQALLTRCILLVLGNSTRGGSLFIGLMFVFFGEGSRGNDGCDQANCLWLRRLSVCLSASSAIAHAVADCCARAHASVVVVVVAVILVGRSGRGEMSCFSAPLILHQLGLVVVSLGWLGYFSSMFRSYGVVLVREYMLMLSWRLLTYGVIPQRKKKEKKKTLMSMQTYLLHFC